MRAASRGFSTAFLLLVLVPGAVLVAWPALGAPAAAGSSKEPVFIAEIVLLLVCGRLLGEAMQRLGQPSVIGQLLAGIVLGPSVFGALFPHARAAIFPSAAEQKAMLEAISQLGILMLLLLTGMETDLSLVRKVRTPALLVAVSGIAVPFACGVALGELLPDALLPDPEKRLLTALFLGTALSISSIKIVAMVVREMNFMRRNLGQIIVASAILEDTAGWIIISLTLGIAARGTLDPLAILKTVAGIAVFLAASLTLGRPLVFRLIRWVNDTFHIEFAVITAILAVMGAMALVTSALGVQSVLGAFVAGVLVGESPILTRHIDQVLRGLIAALFMPLFFGLAGLGADLRILGDRQMLMLAAALVFVASVGKFGGAFLGAKLSGLSVREGAALGAAMNARGSTEVIVASIGLAQGALTQTLFTMIITMAMLTTSLMPPMLRRALKGLPLREDERIRLEREEIDARGFLATLERLLLAVDETDVGRLAARLAGLVAGARGMPVTLLAFEPEPGQAKDAPAHAAAEREIKSGARASAASVASGEHAEPPRKVAISRDAGGEARLAEIAQRGFDLLFVGVADARAPDGHFSAKVTQIVDESRAVLALLLADAKRAEAFPKRSPHILVPVTGTAASRRGAEIAFVLARALDARVTALYVSRWKDARPRARLSTTRRNEESILKDMAELAGRYGVDVRTAIEAHATPDAPIRRQAARHDLIVMGTNRRPGDVLNLGNTAAAIARDVGLPILFVAE